MAIGTSIVLPLPSGNVTLVKINQDNYASEFLFKNSTHEYRLKIRHSTTTKGTAVYDRHNVELVQTIYAAGAVAEYQRKCYYVIEQLPSDTSVDNPDGLFDLAVATTDAFITDLYGWQS